MAVTVSSQPASNSINAAYRPILITGSMSAAMPITYCDIYFNNVYYKTITKTDQSILFPVFDIQVAAQEYLKEFLAGNGGSIAIRATDIFTECFCRLRGSSINGNGFTIPDPVVPIQATMTTPAVSGTGTDTNVFYIVNASLQVEDNQVLATHLNTFKTGTWDADAFPLSHRKFKYRTWGSDYFPIFYRGSANLSCIKIYYTKKDGTTGNAEECTVFPACPTITGETIAQVNNGLDQTFHVEWTTPNGLLYIIAFEYRVANSTGPWLVGGTSSAIFGDMDVTLPLGLYDIRLKSYVNWPFDCDPQYSAEWEDQGDDVACNPPVVTETTLPDGQELVLYSHSMAIVGTTPFNLTGITKPAWMTIAISGSNVLFSGTPPAASAATGITVEFTVNNACGSPDTITQTIDVIASSIGNPRQVKYETTEVGTCSAVAGIVYLPPPAVNIAPGIIVYTDILMTTPLTGFNYIKDHDPSGNIHEIDSVTGLVGADTMLIC